MLHSVLLFAVMPAGDPLDHIPGLPCCSRGPDPPSPISLSTGAWYADQCQLSLMGVEAVVMTSPLFAPIHAIPQVLDGRVTEQS